MANLDSDIPTRKERFDHLFDQLKTLKSNSLDSALKAVALLLVGAGWITTSDTARKVLAHDALIRWFAFFSIISYAAMFALGIYLTGRTSKKLAHDLTNLNYFQPNYYESLVLSNFEIRAYSLVNTLLAIAVAVNVIRTASYT